jgi:hypothetical protein
LERPSTTPILGGEGAASDQAWDRGRGRTRGRRTLPRPQTLRLGGFAGSGPARHRLRPNHRRRPRDQRGPRLGRRDPRRGSPTAGHAKEERASRTRRRRPALANTTGRASRAFFGKRARGLDIDRLVAAARTSLQEQPHSFAELSAEPSELEPGRDPEALAYAARSHLPLVQPWYKFRWAGSGAPGEHSLRPRRGVARPSALRLR